MCDYCKLVIGTLCLPHDPLACPLKKSIYCIYCSEYGHTSKTCELKCTSMCLVEETPPQPRQYKPVLDVVNTPHCIRAIISSYERAPSGRPKQNIVILEEIAEAIGSRLVLHPYKNHDGR